MKALNVLIFIFPMISLTSNSYSFDLNKISGNEMNELLTDDNRDFDYEASCLLGRIKPEMGAAAVNAVRDSCKIKSYPKKCRGGKFIKTCTEACKKEGYFSRKFGECSVGD